MLGLAFPGIAAIPSPYGLPVIFNIASSLHDTQQFFSFRLGRDVGSTPGNSTFNIGRSAAAFHNTQIHDPTFILICRSARRYSG